MLLRQPAQNRPNWQQDEPKEKNWPEESKFGSEEKFLQQVKLEILQCLQNLHPIQKTYTLFPAFAQAHTSTQLVGQLGGAAHCSQPGGGGWARATPRSRHGREGNQQV